MNLSNQYETLFLQDALKSMLVLESTICSVFDTITYKIKSEYDKINNVQSRISQANEAITSLYDYKQQITISTPKSFPAPSSPELVKSNNTRMKMQLVSVPSEIDDVPLFDRTGLYKTVDESEPINVSSVASMKLFNTKSGIAYKSPFAIKEEEYGNIDFETHNEIIPAPPPSISHSEHLFDLDQIDLPSLIEDFNELVLPQHIEGIENIANIDFTFNDENIIEVHNKRVEKEEDLLIDPGVESEIIVEPPPIQLSYHNQVDSPQKNEEINDYTPRVEQEQPKHVQEQQQAPIIVEPEPHVHETVENVASIPVPPPPPPPPPPMNKIKETPIREVAKKEVAPPAPELSFCEMIRMQKDKLKKKEEAPKNDDDDEEKKKEKPTVVLPNGVIFQLFHSSESSSTEYEEESSYSDWGY